MFGASLVVQMVKSPWVEKIPWRRKWQPIPVHLLGKSHGRRCLVGYRPWGREELYSTERLHFHFSLSCAEEGNGNPLQDSSLENPMNRGIWRAPVCRVAKSWTILKWLSTHTVFDKYCFALPGITILGTELEYWVWNEWMDYTKLGIAQRWACEFWLHQHPAAWPREYSFSWLCFFPLAY